VTVTGSRVRPRNDGDQVQVRLDEGRLVNLHIDKTCTVVAPT